MGGQGEGQSRRVGCLNSFARRHCLRSHAPKFDRLALDTTADTSPPLPVGGRARLGLRLLSLPRFGLLHGPRRDCISGGAAAARGLLSDQACRWAVDPECLQGARASAGAGEAPQAPALPIHPPTPHPFTAAERRLEP
eukprot:scaffold4384_cov113-Isochrysis_galbana.AAC.1